MTARAKKKTTTLYCFSPPVMLATLLVEFGGVVYLVGRNLFKRRPTSASHFILLAGLVCLGTFQLVEYLICQGMSLYGLDLARLGFVAITVLPPLGISLALRLANKNVPRLEAAMYLTCFSFVAYYGFVSGSVGGEVCGGNYVMFQLAPDSRIFFSAYYLGLLLAGVTLSWSLSRQLKDQKRLKALRYLTGGYLVFLLPTIIIALLNEPARGSIPSIMCGFAVFLALILLTKVLPVVDELADPKVDKYPALAKTN